MRAIRAYAELKEDWAETDRLLSELVKVGRIPECTYLVYVSEVNSHMVVLRTSLYRSNSEVDFHIREAARDMQSAEEFVKSLL